MIRMHRYSWLALALLVAVVPSASADTFLVYSQGGIPAGSDLFTWCDSGQPCEALPPLSCATDPFDGVVASPEGGNSFLMRTNVWAGWGVFPQQPLDLRDYAGELRFWVKAPPASIGPFNIKVEFKCNPDPVGFPGGVTYTTSIGAHGWDGTDAWQEISIPLVDSSFGTPVRPLDDACFSTVTGAFFATIENLPFFDQFWIDYVRWETPTSLPGGSTVTVQDRQLLVNGEPFVVNGVAYSAISIGENWTGAWRAVSYTHLTLPTN